MTDIRAICKEPFHENELLHYYCKECSVCICHKCGQTRHNQHRKVDIQEAAKERKDQRRKVVELAKTEVFYLEEKVEEQRRLMKASEEEIVATKNEVTEQVQEAIRHLKEHEEEIKTQITELTKTQQKQHLTRLEYLQSRINHLSASIEYDEGVVEKSDCFEMLQAENDAFSLHEENLNLQRIEIYRPEHSYYVWKQESLNVLRHLELGKIVASHTDPSKSWADGKGLKEAKQGSESVFTIFTCDSQGSQCYSEEDEVSVKISISEEKDKNSRVFRLSRGEGIDDCKDGSYRVCYKLATDALCQVTIEVNGCPLNNSPWKVVVIPHRLEFTRALFKSECLFPWSIALNEKTGEIAVASYFDSRILLFDEQLTRSRKIEGGGSRNRVSIGHPMSLAFLRNDDLVFTHEFKAHEEQMSLYTANGGFIRGFSKHLVRPLSVFVKTEGDGQVIVCDVGDNTIKVLSPDGTILLQSFSPPKCNDSPEFVFHKNGTFFASYIRQHCVKVFNNEGVFLYDIGSYGCGEGQLNSPAGLTVDAYNQLIVCDSGNGRVQVFSLSGKFLYTMQAGSAPGSACALQKPWFVTVSSDNQILISDSRPGVFFIFVNHALPLNTMNRTMKEDLENSYHNWKRSIIYFWKRKSRHGQRWKTSTC